MGADNNDLFIYRYTRKWKELSRSQDIIHKLKGKDGFNKVIANFNITSMPEKVFIMWIIRNGRLLVQFSKDNHKRNIEVNLG